MVFSEDFVLPACLRPNIRILPGKCVQFMQFYTTPMHQCCKAWLHTVHKLISVILMVSYRHDRNGVSNVCCVAVLVKYFVN